MERKVIIRNVICSLMLQAVTILSGFIVPKVILNYFGSDVNGLITSINQFLNYIQLLEGGLSGVIMSALYKPLAENNQEKISSVINATQLFFKKIALIFVFYMIGVAFLYPLFIKTNFSYLYSIALVVVLGSHLFVQYFFSLSLKLLLNADRKVYIVSLTQIIIVAINMIAVIVFAKLFSDVLLIKIASAIVFLIQPLVYGKYVKKHYKIDSTILPDNTALSQRWSGFGINLAYFVHTNTDVIILTVFSTLSSVSVYGVYLMVVNAMKNLVMSISQAINPSLGKSLASDDLSIANSKFDLYEFGIYLFTTVVFSSGLFLITPFIRIFTANITDANYEQYTFGYILTLAEMIYCYRDSYVSASYVAGHFKQVTRYAIIEVVLNLTISLLLVRDLGILGVAIGTLVSMLYRGVAHVMYLKKKILMRNPFIALKRFLVFSSITVLSLTISNTILSDTASDYFEWIFLSLKNVSITLILTFIGIMLFFKKQTVSLLGSRLNRIFGGKNE